MNKVWDKLKKTEYLIPFWTAVIVGFLTHMCIFVNKFPNSDAMTNFYFDQNMVTSGRWFLMVVCGISSFYDLNWIIGVLSILYLGIAAVLLNRFWEIKSKPAMIVISALLVTFPAVTATAAYLYTMDGYMIGLCLSILAVFLAKKYKWGFIPGAVCLAFSMGIYQAYLAVTILLCIFAVIGMLMNRDKIKEILIKGLKFLGMGAGGGILYFIILKICLAAQHKVLDTYQGLNEMGTISASAMPERIKNAYLDFVAFVLRGNIFANNRFSLAVVLLLGVVLIMLMLFIFIKSGAFKDWYRYPLLAVMMVLIPVGCNIILLMSSGAYYHLLMRMQWVLFPMCIAVLADKVLCPLWWENSAIANESKKKNAILTTKVVAMAAWTLLAVMAYRFAIADNIAYFNMNERYEKTYAYCVRLLDRMEQTEGYEPGMKVAMIGVIADMVYPDNDITTDYTERISGTGGSFLIYNSEQFAAFMKHYLNVTFEPVTGDEMVEIYNSKEYSDLGTFPASDSMKVVDGILYIKTENQPEWYN